MSTYDYAPITATALRLITKFGTDVILSRDSSALWVKKYDREEFKEYWENPITGYISFTEPTDIATTTGIGIITKFTSEGLRGRLVESNDMRLTVMSIPEPQLGDIFIIGSVEYKYIDHLNVAPDGNTIVYVVQVRI